MDGGQSPQIRTFPARYGLNWLLQGLSLMRAQPGRLLFLVVLLQLILGLSRLPLVGIFIIMAMPALSAGLLQAFHQVARGQRATAANLLEPLASGPRTGRLLLLGILMFLVGIICVSLLLSGAAGMPDAATLARIEQGDADAMAALDPQLIGRIVLAVVAGVSLSGTLSFMAIPLLWFRSQKLGFALVSGLRALVVNWRPFTLLAAGLSLLLIPVVLAIAALFELAGVSGGLSLVLLCLIMLITLAFQLAVFATQYCSFRDIFGLETDRAGAAPDVTDDHQFLA